MEQIYSIEVTLTEWYKKAPHLPRGGRSWLAHNAWWLALIGLVLSVLGLVSVLSLLFFANLALFSFGVMAGGSLGAVAGATLGGMMVAAAVVSLALFIAQTAMLGMSISPLKMRKKRGWNLLFYIFLLNLVVNVVVHALSFDLISIVMGIVWAAIGGYFLFEMREYFGVKKVAVAKSVEKDDKPKPKAVA